MSIDDRITALVESAHSLPARRHSAILFWFLGAMLIESDDHRAAVRFAVDALEAAFHGAAAEKGGAA